MTKNETDKLSKLAESVKTLANILDTIIDNNVDIAKELQKHKDECISLCNRVNEVELIIEAKREPLVMPVVRRKRNGFNSKTGEVKTPYPKQKNVLEKAYYKLRRIINAST
jgi:hypothetical protein